MKSLNKVSDKISYLALPVFKFLYRNSSSNSEDLKNDEMLNLRSHVERFQYGRQGPVLNYSYVINNIFVSLSTKMIWYK